MGCPSAAASRFRGCTLRRLPLSHTNYNFQPVIFIWTWWIFPNLNLSGGTAYNSVCTCTHMIGCRITILYVFQDHFCDVTDGKWPQSYHILYSEWTPDLNYRINLYLNTKYRMMTHGRISIQYHIPAPVITSIFDIMWSGSGSGSGSGTINSSFWPT